MLVHRRSFPRNLLGFPPKFTGTHLYTWVERGTLRVKCLAQEHNTCNVPARARTRTTRSGDERTNHEATALPTSHACNCLLIYHCDGTKLVGNLEIEKLKRLEKSSGPIAKWASDRHVIQCNMLFSSTVPFCAATSCLVFIQYLLLLIEIRVYIM